MGSKKTTQTTQQHTVTKPDVPQWVQDSTSTLNTALNNWMGKDPSTLVAKTSPLTQKAYNTASGIDLSSLYGGINPQAHTVGSSSLLDNLGAYQNPYLKDVVDTTLGDYDVNAGKTRAMQAAQAAQGGAFRGSRYALREANTEDALARGRAATEAGLRSQAFDTAANLSSQDAARRQQSDMFNAWQMSQADQLALQLAQARQSGATTQSQLLAALGGQQQAQNQAEINAPYTQALQGSALLQALNPQLFTGQTSDSNGTTTSKTSGGALGALGTLAMLAAAPLTGGTSLLGMGLGAAGLGGLAGAAGTAAGLGGAVSGLTRI